MKSNQKLIFGHLKNPTTMFFNTRYFIFFYKSRAFFNSLINKFKISYYSEEQIKAMMGAIMDQNRDKELAETLQIQNLYDEGPNSDQLPDSFDAREKWTECPFPIRDQGHCGSCWAFGAVEAFEDRICIASKGELKLDLSEQNIVSCNYLGLGCSGNLPINAFAYLSLIGIPTEEWIPYTSGKTGSAWGWTFECDNPEVSSKRYSCKYPWVNFTTKGIKNEIMTNGPVETAFGVWGDFMNYKTGIYIIYNYL